MVHSKLIGRIIYNIYNHIYDVPVLFDKALSNVFPYYAHCIATKVCMENEINLSISNTFN